MPGVLQAWVNNLPLREQGVLVLSLRGPDGTRKESGVKNIVRAFRGCVLVTGATGQPLLPGENLPDDSFMEMYRVGHVDEAPWQTAVTEFFRSWDEYNIHFLLHLMHAAEILGFRHPNKVIRDRWQQLYLRCCKKSHLNPETEGGMIARLKDGPKPDHPD